MLKLGSIRSSNKRPYQYSQVDMEYIRNRMQTISIETNDNTQFDYDRDSKSGIQQQSKMSMNSVSQISKQNQKHQPSIILFKNEEIEFYHPKYSIESHLGNINKNNQKSQELQSFIKEELNNMKSYLGGQRKYIKNFVKKNRTLDQSTNPYKRFNLQDHSSQSVTEFWQDCYNQKNRRDIENLERGVDLFIKNIQKVYNVCKNEKRIKRYLMNVRKYHLDSKTELYKVVIKENQEFSISLSAEQIKNSMRIFTPKDVQGKEINLYHYEFKIISELSQINEKLEELYKGLSLFKIVKLKNSLFLELSEAKKIENELIPRNRHLTKSFGVKILKDTELSFSNKAMHDNQNVIIQIFIDPKKNKQEIILNRTAMRYGNLPQINKDVRLMGSHLNQALESLQKKDLVNDEMK